MSGLRTTPLIENMRGIWNAKTMSRQTAKRHTTQDSKAPFFKRKEGNRRRERVSTEHGAPHRTVQLNNKDTRNILSKKKKPSEQRSPLGFTHGSIKQEK